MDPNAIGQKLTNDQFRRASGAVLGITLLMAAARLFIKTRKLRRIYADDWFFIAAVATLIGGTVAVFLVLPYNQLQMNVASGIEPPPPDMVRQMDLNVKFQACTLALTNASIFSIKFSFLFFFRKLMEGTNKLRRYWYFVVIFTVPCAIVCICTEFMVCPAFGERIIPVCTTIGALPRQTATLYTVVMLSIVTDLLVVSIPVLLLWNIKINNRRKFGLGFVLVLSIFSIITNIIRAAGHELRNGQNDIAWLLFWIYMEACIAVIANAMTAFPSLFLTRGPKRQPSPQPDQCRPIQAGPEAKQLNLRMPNITSPKISGLRSFLTTDPFRDHDAPSAEPALVLDDGDWSRKCSAVVTSESIKPTNREKLENGSNSV